MTFDRWDILFTIVGAMIAYTVLAYRHALPAVSSVQELANVVNTKGGNILVLVALTMLFFFTGVGMVYWMLDRIQEGKLSVDNAVLMMGLSWVTGTAFGGAFSAMLKVMSGENPIPPAGTTTTSTTSVATVPTTSKAEVEKAIAAAVNVAPVSTELKAIPKA